MARTIEQIKSEITEAWLNNATLQTTYGFAPNSEWGRVFSKVSLENILVYIIAASMWMHEKLFDTHKAEVEDYIAQMKPHTLRWYVNKVKAFRAGQDLIEGTDQYSDEGLTDEDIDALQVVRFAAATESEATIYIKVATENGTQKAPISAEQLAGLKAYIAEVKDAGVRVDFVNEQGSLLRLQLVIYYNPMVLDSRGQNLSTGTKPVEDAISSYIENLPFNGEYRNDRLIDALQAVEGVEQPELTGVEESYDGATFLPVNARTTPYAGYYDYSRSEINITYLPYEPYAN